eukprot:5113637-Amphidinium_carterae.1
MDKRCLALGLIFHVLVYAMVFCQFLCFVGGKGCVGSGWSKGLSLPAEVRELGPIPESQPTAGVRVRV